MTLLEKINAIENKSAEFQQKASEHIDDLTMPHRALGRLCDLAEQLCAIQQTIRPETARKKGFVFAADHGIAEEGVSLFPQEVTTQMVPNFVNGKSGVSVLNTSAGAETYVVDVGVKGDLSALYDEKKIFNKRIASGSNNFLKEEAMTEEQALKALAVGFEIAEKFQGETDIFATGEMGIANTTPSSAIVSVATGIPPEKLTGMGAGLQKERILHKIQVIEKALEKHKPNPKDAIDILKKVGGYEIGAIAGFILGAAYYKKTILIDGFISSAAAILAVILQPKAKDYMILSHASAEPGHQAMCEFLGLKPLINLGLRLGEGTGCSLAFPILQAAADMIKNMATFSESAVTGPAS